MRVWLVQIFKPAATPLIYMLIYMNCIACWVAYRPVARLPLCFKLAHVLVCCFGLVNYNSLLWICCLAYRVNSFSKKNMCALLDESNADVTASWEARLTQTPSLMLQQPFEQMLLLPKEWKRRLVHLQEP